MHTDLGYMAILKNVCGQHSMREMEENFNKETCIDTLNYYLEKLSLECLSGLRKKMVTNLIQGKQFSRGRLRGKYWQLYRTGAYRGLWAGYHQHQSSKYHQRTALA